jgi:hypothetical protein
VINFLFADDAPDFRKVTVEFFNRHAPRYDLFKQLGYRYPLRLVSPLEVEDEE